MNTKTGRFKEMLLNPKVYRNELKRWYIRYKVSDMRIFLYGGDNKARRHYEAILEDNPELEAQLILIASNNDADLRYKLEERAAIRQADGLPGDLLSAALSYIQR